MEECRVYKRLMGIALFVVIVDFDLSDVERVGEHIFDALVIHRACYLWN